LQKAYKWTPCLTCLLFILIIQSQASGTQEEMRHFLERTEEKIERIHHELDGKASLSDLARVSVRRIQ
jgi:hypothetical protein